MAKDQHHVNVNRAYEERFDFEVKICNKNLFGLLKELADSVSCKMDMVLLPVLTASCSLMGMAQAKTHREDINFVEPNIMWTCVAAEPGSRKTVAMAAVSRALRTVESQEGLVEEIAVPLNESALNSTLQPIPLVPRLFNENETITMAKLHDELISSNGVYLALFDEIEGLFESLDSQGRPDSKDRRMWLSLHSGSQWARNSKAGRNEISKTRLSYTGYMQPELLIDRLRKKDVDGVMDRHWVWVAERRTMRFQEIGKDCPEGLSRLFSAIYSNHKRGELHSYKLDQEAGVLFQTHFDDMEGQIRELLAGGPQVYSQRKHMIGTMNKSAGNALRLSMVFQAIANAFDDTPDKVISCQSLQMAINVIQHSNRLKQRLILSKPQHPCNPEMVHVDAGAYTAQDDGEFLELHKSSVKRLLSSAGRVIHSTETLQHQRYDVSSGRGEKNAKAFMSKVANAGFGTIELGPTKRSIILKKRKAEELSESCKKFITENDIPSFP